jgi:hypothetical protein
MAVKERVQTSDLYTKALKELESLKTELKTSQRENVSLIE